MTADVDAGPPRLAGLVLAAGASRRLGQPKQLVTWGGQTLLARAVSHALAVCDAGVVVVTGASAARVAASLTDLQCSHADLRLVFNPDWSHGIGASIAQGIRALRDAAPEPAGVLTLLCDQPTIARRELVSLVNLWQTNPQSIAAARYAAGRGVPAVFPREHFAVLEQLTGATGAKQVLAAADGVLELALPAAAFDVDTPAALQALEHRSADTD